jgi:hypothetical protein
MKAGMLPFLAEVHARLSDTGVSGLFLPVCPLKLIMVRNLVLGVTLLT